MKNTTSKVRRAVPFVAILVTAGIITLASRDLPRIDSSNVERIEFGMNERQVVRIVGVPAGDYATSPSAYRLACNPFCYKESWGDRPLATRKDWVTDDSQLILGFNDRGEVCFKQLYSLPAAPSTPWLSFVLPLYKSWSWLRSWL